MAKRKKQSSVDFPDLRGAGLIAIDCETRDPDLRERGSGAHKPGCYIAGVAVGTDTGYREYFPIAHEQGPNLPREAVLSWLGDQLRTPVPKIGANLLYDIGFLSEAGIEVGGLLYDVQIAEPLLDENRFTYSLESLSKKYLGIGKIDDDLDAYLIEHYGKKNPKGNIWRAPSDIVRPYAIGDVNHPLEIFAKQKPELEKQGLWDLFIMETKLVPMLAKMRRRGVRIDVPRAEAMYERMTEEQERLQSEIGQDVSVWAAKSIAPLFDKKGIEYPLTPKTKQPSLTKEFLERCNEPLARTILEIRRLDKMRETFLQGSLLEVHDQGRIHCQFNQMKGDEGGTVTGRFSSSKPNLQFIPTRTEEGKLLRQMFIPDEGQKWYKFDYSQIEYRLIAHDANDMRMRGADEVVRKYIEDPNTDFHAVVAEMTGLDRSRAKTINFGLAYGEGVDKLCAGLGVSRKEGEKILNEYHRRAPFIKPLSDLAMSTAARTGVIETLMGRKRRFDTWALTRWKPNGDRETTVVPHRVRGAQRFGTHKALNARIQGSAADIMKKAMVDVYESGVCDVLGVPSLTVHDELDGSYPDTKIGREALREMHHVMENCVKLTVPLVVEGEVGDSWGSGSKEAYLKILKEGKRSARSAKSSVAVVSRPMKQRRKIEA